MPLDHIDFDAPGLAEAMEQAFHKQHEELYTFASPDQEVDLVTARVALVGRVPRGAVAETIEPGGAMPAPAGERRVFTGGTETTVPLYALEDLATGHEVTGPALIEAETTTVILHAGDHATLTPQGWLDIAVAAKVGMG